MSHRSGLVGRGRLFPPAVTTLLLLLVSLSVPEPAVAQKTDSVMVRNGDRIVGEIKGMERGQLEFKTDAMKTVYVQWPKVVTVQTDKTFEIVLDDGTMHFGSLDPGSQDSVVIRADTGSVVVATQAVVALQRIKASFWAALDGNIDLGIDFTQQNAKTDLNLSGSVRYAARLGLVHGLGMVTGGFNVTNLNFSSTFSRQDDTDDIERLNASLSHARQLDNRWFWVLALAGERNSQLSLDFRGTVAGGAGRFIVQSNKLDLGLWIGPSFSRERFTGESADNSFPLILAADFEYFTWGALNTDLSSQLSLMPILDQWGRWRINFNVSVNREVLTNLYIKLGVTEAFDSAPTAADANKNDFSLTTSFGWNF
jgi:hypothetical protein